MLNVGDTVKKYLQSNNNLYRVAEIFGPSFRTNHAHVEHERQDNAYSYLFLMPTQSIRQRHDINREVLFYADESSKFTSRVFDNIARILEDNKLRLVQDIVFVASQDPDAPTLCAEHLEQTGTKLIYCSYAELQAAVDEDFADELLRRFLYSRDLFDVRDPVSSDEQFFVRYKVVDELYDALLKGMSCGIFGLRKIGKTSVLKRLRLKNDANRGFIIAYLDAQAPVVYANDPAGIAFEIAKAFNGTYAATHGRPFQTSIPSSGSLLEATRFLSDFLNRFISHTNKPLLVVIDELERILPTASPTNTWNAQYVHLWRLLRAESQARAGKFVFLVASTNPYFTEVANVAGEDNPLYRFIRPRYLNPFTRDDLFEMLNKLGKPMGVAFDAEAVSTIHDWFGGHPFLSRQICSAVARDLPERPLRVTARGIQRTIDEHGPQFRGDLDAILKVFDDYYPEERQVLEELARDERKGLAVLAQRPLAGQHLVGYGLLRQTKHSYRFTMAALPPYLLESPPPKFKQEEIPNAVRERHETLQRRMNHIEPSLRTLVLGTLQSEFGRDWFKAIQMKNADRDRIEAKGNVTALQVIEETYVTDLLSTILHHWKLFAKVFESRDEFKKQQKQLGEVARSLSDHRKYQACADDAQYLIASEACDWFERRLV